MLKHRDLPAELRQVRQISIRWNKGGYAIKIIKIVLFNCIYFSVT
jgi:hypothetical protein